MPAFLHVRMEDFMRSTDKKRDNKVLMSLRISAEDKEQIEEKARKTGLTTSEYMLWGENFHATEIQAY